MPTLEESVPFAIQAPIAKVSTLPGFNVNIEVHIDVKLSELEDLGEKLKILMEILSRNGSEEVVPSKNAEQKG